LFFGEKSERRKMATKEAARTAQTVTLLSWSPDSWLWTKKAIPNLCFRWFYRQATIPLRFQGSKKLSFVHLYKYVINSEWMVSQDFLLLVSFFKQLQRKKGWDSSRLFLKKILIALSSIMYLLARHIKAELGRKVPQLGFREYIFWCLVRCILDQTSMYCIPGVCSGSIVDERIL